MKKLFLLKSMLLLCALIVGSGMTWAAKITAKDNIVANSHYYIGATVSAGDCYLKIDGSSIATGVSGVGTTNKSEAIEVILEAGSSTDKWKIKVASSGYYLTLASSDANGKMNVQAAADEWTVEDVTSAMRFSINSHRLQKNTSNQTSAFGSYKTTSNQKDIWLEPALADNNLTITSSSPVALTITNETPNPTSTITWTTSSDGALTWNTSNSSVATVANGVITAQGAGTANITVSQAATSSYAASETKTIVVNVTDNTKTTCDLALTGAPVALTFDLYNNATPQVINYTTSSTGEVTVSTSSYISAVVNESAKTITVTPLIETTETQTITVSQAADASYNAGSTSFTVSIDDSTPYVQPTNVTVSFTSDLVENSTDKTWTKVTDNVTAVYAKASGSNTYTNGQIRLYPKNTITVTAPSGFVITGIEFNEPSSSKTWNNEPTANPGTYSSATKSWSGSASEVVFTGTGSTGHCRIESITVILSIPVAVGAKGYATYTNNTYALDFTGKSIKAYTISSTDGSALTLTQKDKVAKGEPVLLYSETNSDSKVIPVIDDAEATADATNKLVAGTGSALTWTESNRYYILYTGGATPGFYKANNSTIASGKAYLDLSDVDARALSFDLTLGEGETTGIANVGTKTNVENAKVFNLAGQQVAQPVKGLYIVNGKKAVIK